MCPIHDRRRRSRNVARIGEHCTRETTLLSVNDNECHAVLCVLSCRRRTVPTASHRCPGCTIACKSSQVRLVQYALMCMINTIVSVAVALHQAIVLGQARRRTCRCSCTARWANRASARSTRRRAGSEAACVNSNRRSENDGDVFFVAVVLQPSFLLFWFCADDRSWSTAEDSHRSRRRRRWIRSDREATRFRCDSELTSSVVRLVPRQGRRLRWRWHGALLSYV